MRFEAEEMADVGAGVCWKGFEAHSIDYQDGYMTCGDETRKGNFGS